MFAAFAELVPVELTLYTDALVIRGSVWTRQRRITDILNHAEDPFLVLEDVSVDELGPHGATSTAAFAQVNLDAVLFAVADAPVEPSPELRTPKQQEPALVSVPPFKVVGTIHLLPAGNLREALTELTGRFLPVTDAAFWSDAIAVARTEALLVAVNHRRAQILAPHRVVDPWAGLDRPAQVDRPGGDAAAGRPPPAPEQPGG